MIHGPDVATRINGDSVSRFDLTGLDRVLHLADMVGVDCSCQVDSPGVGSKFKIFL